MARVELPDGTRLPYAEGNYFVMDDGSIYEPGRAGVVRWYCRNLGEKQVEVFPVTWGDFRRAEPTGLAPFSADIAVGAE